MGKCVIGTKVNVTSSDTVISKVRLIGFAFYRGKLN